MKFRITTHRPHGGAGFIRIWPATSMTAPPLAAILAFILYLRKAAR